MTEPKLIAKPGEKALVLLSGGIDSTVALYLAKQRGLDVKGLQFFHGARPDEEANSVFEIASKVDVPLFYAHYPEVGEYGGEVFPVNESNSLYYIVAADFAKKQNISHIIAGQIRDDYTHFDAPVAEPSFYDRLNALLKVEQGDQAPQIQTPLIYMNKIEVVQLGKELDVPFDLTWSCTQTREKDPCQTCYQCESRDDAMKKVFGTAYEAMG